MNFAIPRNNNSEMLLYIWKIIDLPSISLNDLLYKISFDLFLFSPDNAIAFIKKCIKDKLLIKNPDQNLQLSNLLTKKLENWQNKRKKEILEKLNSTKKINQLKKDMQKNESSNFSVLINAFTDKATLNRSVSVADEAFELLEYNIDKGILKSKVLGSKKESYLIEIDSINKILYHNCHDFETRRAENKKFCKHITKLFLLLRENNENSAEFFLKNLVEKIDKWEFTF
ncbi:MAG: hypothetical protein ACFE91_07950 [Promethearchaeota archaeon]